MRWSSKRPLKAVDMCWDFVSIRPKRYDETSALIFLFHQPSSHLHLFVFAVGCCVQGNQVFVFDLFTRAYFRSQLHHGRKGGHLFLCFFYDFRSMFCVCLQQASPEESKVERLQDDVEIVDTDERALDVLSAYYADDGNDGSKQRDVVFNPELGLAVERLKAGVTIEQLFMFSFD
jgi:hypothetical protein